MKKTFKNAKQFQKLIDAYFESLEPEFVRDGEGNMIFDKTGAPVMTERKPATLASMAYAVGLSSKDELTRLEESDEYSEPVKRALLRTEAYIERMLFDKAASAGAKYLLKESFGYEQCEETERDVDGGVVILPTIEEAEGG